MHRSLKKSLLATISSALLLATATQLYTMDSKGTEEAWHGFALTTPSSSEAQRIKFSIDSIKDQLQQLRIYSEYVNSNYCKLDCALKALPYPPSLDYRQFAPLIGSQHYGLFTKEITGEEKALIHIGRYLRRMTSALLESHIDETVIKNTLKNMIKKHMPSDLGILAARIAIMILQKDGQRPCQIVLQEIANELHEPVQEPWQITLAKMPLIDPSFTLQQTGISEIPTPTRQITLAPAEEHLSSLAPQRSIAASSSSCSLTTSPTAGFIRQRENFGRTVLTRQNAYLILLAILAYGAYHFYNTGTPSCAIL